MLSFYVNYRASSFACFFFLKNKELLKFEPQMSFLLDETSQQKGVSQFLKKLVSYVQDSTVSLMFL